MSVMDLGLIARRLPSFHLGRGREAPLGFKRGTIPDRAPVLANRPPLTDARVPEVALKAPVGLMHQYPEGERLPARSQRGTWHI
jgi:hypothetical protein